MPFYGGTDQGRYRSLTRYGRDAKGSEGVGPTGGTTAQHDPMVSAGGVRTRKPRSLVPGQQGSPVKRRRRRRRG